VVCEKARDDATTLVIYVDLQAEIKAVADFYMALAEGIHRRLPATDRLALPAEGSLTKRAFEKWLASPQLANYRLIVLLDEFETLRAEDGFDADFFKGLRSLVSRHLAWVTTSYRDLYRLSRVLGECEKTSPFFNIFHPTPIILGGLTTDDVDDLIRKPASSCGVRFFAEEIVSIQRLAGPLPFFLQAAAEVWFDAKRRGMVSTQIKAQVKQQFLTSMDRHFDWYWVNFEEDERTLLTRIASEAPTDWSVYRQQYGDITLNDLLDYGLIASEGESYHIVGDAFAEWIRRRVRFSHSSERGISQTGGRSSAEPRTNLAKRIIQEREVSQETFAVFLSHNGDDKPVVEVLAQSLAQSGIRPWLDIWNLVPGDPWQEAIEEALDACQTVAVFLGPNGIGPWQNEEMRSALEDRVRDKSRRVIPVLLPGAPDPHQHPLPRFLRRLTWVDFRAGINDPDAFQRLVSGIKGEAPRPTIGRIQPLQTGLVLPVEQEQDVVPRLERFNLQDETDPIFGDNDLTKDLLQRRRNLKQIDHFEVQRATSAVMFLAIPSASVQADKIAIIRTARELFDPIRWYDTNRPGRRYHAREAFPLRGHKVRTSRAGVVVEQIYERPDEKLLIDILTVNQFAEVAYATSYHMFDEFVEGHRIFRLGAIVNFFWSFLCMAWEFYESIGYTRDSHACVAMINTEGSFLGNFAEGWPDPYKQIYWMRFARRSEEICHDPNILVCRNVDFATFQPKVEPDVLYQVAEEIALAFNQTEARCFERNTRKLMKYKLHS